MRNLPRTLFFILAAVTATHSSHAAPAKFNSEFVTIPHGTFQMGSPVSEVNRDGDEDLHTVTLTQDFDLQAAVLTQVEWVSVMDSNPSHFKTLDACKENHRVIRGIEVCPDLPVEQVTWNDTQKFIEKLNATDREYQYRLPTEAEWEYAARAGSPASYSFGDSFARLGEYAWFYDNSEGRLQPARGKKPNAFGLYGMHGNVWQWVHDVYSLYPDHAVVDPKGPSVNTEGHIYRGGAWFNYPKYLRSANRNHNEDEYPSRELGFRLVRRRICR